MISFHGNKKIKEKYLKRILGHIKAEELVRGIGWVDGKGCAVGCTLEDYEHKNYETELGIPEWLARLEDSLFEGMSLKKSKTWPHVFLKSIPVGVNLHPIKYKFSVFLIKENINRVMNLKDIDDNLKEKVIDGIRKVLSVNEKSILNHWSDEQFWSAARSARSAAESAARSARSAAESAAESAAWSAARSVWSAAESAAWSARSAAESAAWSAWSAWSAAESAAESAAWSAARSARSAAWSAARSVWSAAESAARSEESAWSAWSATTSAAFDRYADELLRLIKEKAL